MLNTNFPQTYKCRCVKCNTYTTIPSSEMKHEKVWEEERSMGYETEHFYYIHTQCPKCNYNMSIEYNVFEYPENFFNMCYSKNKNCKIKEHDPDSYFINE